MWTTCVKPHSVTSLSNHVHFSCNISLQRTLPFLEELRRSRLILEPSSPEMTFTSSAVAWWDILCPAGIKAQPLQPSSLPPDSSARWLWKPPSGTATRLCGRMSIRWERCLNGWGTSWLTDWRPAAWSGRKPSGGTTVEREFWVFDDPTHRRSS